MSSSTGLQQPTGATTALAGVPGITPHMLPVTQVYTNHGTELNLYPYAVMKQTVAFDNVSGGSQLVWEPHFNCYDIVKRLVRVNYLMKVTLNQANPNPADAAADLRQDIPPSFKTMADYIEPYPNGFNNLIEYCQVSTDGSSVEMNSPRDTWLVHEIGRSKDLSDYTSTYNGKGDGKYWDYQYVNQPLATTLGGTPGSYRRASPKLVTAGRNYAIFYCTDYILNGLFLAEGDSEAEQGLTNINRLTLRIKLNSNYNDLIRISAPLVRAVGDDAGKTSTLLTAYKVSLSGLTMEMDAYAMDTLMTLVPTIAQRPFTGVRSFFQSITNPIPKYNFYDLAAYPAESSPTTVSVRNYICNAQYSHLIIGVQKRGRNQDIVGIGGSPFTITNLSIANSNSAVQLKTYTNAQLALITESNSAWWPQNLFDRAANETDAAPTNLPSTSRMNVPAAGGWVVIGLKDFTQGRITTDGLIARYSLNIDVGLAFHTKGAAESRVSLESSDYELVVLTVIPSTMTVQNNQMVLQLGNLQETALQEHRANAAKDPSHVGMITRNLGASVRAHASSLSAAGGGWKDWFKKAKSAVTGAVKGAIADPMGAINKGMSIYNDAKGLASQGQSLYNKYKGSGLRPPTNKSIGYARPAPY
jgi:hypothetical protein